MGQASLYLIHRLELSHKIDSPEINSSVYSLAEKDTMLATNDLPSELSTLVRDTQMDDRGMKHTVYFFQTF
jgi:hypothetical protein